MNRPAPLFLRAVPAVVTVVVVIAGVTVAGAYTTSNDWVMRVDGDEIGERQFLDELAAFRDNPRLAEFIPELAQGAKGAVPSSLAAVWLNRLLQQEIVEQLAQERGVSITVTHGQQAEASLTDQFQGEEVWQSFPRWFRSRAVARDALFLALLEDVGGTVTEADVQRQYQAAQDELLQACAAHILVEKLEQAESIKAELDAGGDFAALATQHSIDQGSGPRGGDLGCQRRGSYVEPFDSQVFTLPLDIVSDPVQTQFGFHLIKVSRREVAPLEEVRQEMTQRAQQVVQQRIGELLVARVEEADVEVNPKYGSLELTPEGPRIVPPTPPQPPDRVPIAGPTVESAPIGFLPPGS